MSQINLVDLDTTRKTIDELFEIAVYSLSTQKNVIISYSGGKDSTVLVIAAAEAIKRGEIKPEQVTIIFSDTMLEIPALHAQITRFLDHIKTFGVDIKIVKRPVNQSYWARFLGEGTFASNHFARWCVRDLKINPIKRGLPEGEYIMAIGIRLAESTERKNRYNEKVMTSCDTAGECFAPMEDEPRIFPLLEWKNCDIWDFLMFHETASLYPVDKLRELYFQRDSMRYGCWNCTVARDTELLKLHAANDQNYRKLIEFRAIQEQYKTSGTLPEDWIYVWRKPGPRNTRLEKGKEAWMASRLTVATRKRLLDKLLNIQEETGFNLISEEEVDYVVETWEKFPDEDRKGRPWKYYDGPVQKGLEGFF